MLALVVHRCPTGASANVQVGRGNAPIPIVRRWSSRRFPYGYLVTT